MSFYKHSKSVAKAYEDKPEVMAAIARIKGTLFIKKLALIFGVPDSTCCHWLNGAIPLQKKHRVAIIEYAKTVVIQSEIN
jgi:hypothetical protein